jgi:hypothetical protein
VALPKPKQRAVRSGFARCHYFSDTWGRSCIPFLPWATFGSGDRGLRGEKGDGGMERNEDLNKTGVICNGVLGMLTFIVATACEQA